MTIRNAVRWNSRIIARPYLINCAIGLAMCLNGQAFAAPSGIFRTSTGLDLQNWNPHTQTNLVYVRPVYEGLLQMGADGVTIKPRLAEAWEVTPQQATFKLRRGVVFHDGTPFNADAVIANVENVQKAANRWADTVASIAKMVKVDEYTVRFELKYPDPSLAFTMAQPGTYMISPKALAEGSWQKKPAGTGAYVYDESASVSGSKYVFKYFDKYYAPDEVGPAGIEVHYMADASASFNALLAGQVDAAPSDLLNAGQAEAAGLTSFMWKALRYHMILLDRKETLGDARVRKAVCMAIPSDEINAGEEEGVAEIATQRFDAGDPSFVPDLKGYTYDLEGAKALMAEAGNPKVSFKMPTFAAQLPGDQLIKESLAKIGVDVDLVQMPAGQFFQEFYSGKYPVYRNTMSAERGGMFNYYSFRFAKDGKSNTFRVDPPAKLEAAYQEALKAPAEKQSAYLQEMTRIIHDEALDCGFMDLPNVIHYDPRRVTAISATNWEPWALNYKDIRLKD